MNIEQVFQCESVDELRKEIEHLRQIAFKAGICTDCNTEISHAIEAPFSQCQCSAGTGECGFIPTIPLLRYNLYTAQQALVNVWNRLDGMWSHEQDGSFFAPVSKTEESDKRVADRLRMEPHELKVMKLFAIVHQELKDVISNSLPKPMRSKMNQYVAMLDNKAWAMGCALEEAPNAEKVENV